jgi:hypothetical protein
VVKAVVLWEREPDQDWYARHAELARTVPGATFRHGSIFGSPAGKADAALYAEFEFPDRESFQRGMGSAEMGETVKDAEGTGIPFKAYFVEM